MTTKRPFIAIYCDKLREALLHLEKADFRILQALMLHMDPVGICYPGPALLAELTKHAETTVEASILRLQQISYIRILVHQNPIKRKTEFAYIVSPHIHAVHESNQQLAWQYWQSAQYYENSNFTSTRETKDSQPPPEAPTEPTLVNHRQEAPPPPPPYQPFSPKGVEQENSSTNASTKSARSAKSSGSAAQQRKSSPPVPQLPPLPPDAGKTALGDSQDESAATQIYNQFRGVLTLINARRAVLQYGRKNVLAAAFVALSDPTARSAVAVMFYNLQHDLVTPGVDDATPIEWNRVEWETRTVNFEFEWRQYEHLLNHPDCPEWFRDVMASYANKESEINQASDGVPAATGD